DLHAAIQLPAFGRVVARLRLRLAEAGRGDPAVGHALVDYVVAHRAGTLLGEALVVVVAADVVGVALDADLLVGILAEVVGQLAEGVARLGAQREGVEVEEDVVGQADGDLVLRGAGHFDAGDLLQLFLLLVHLVADGGADGRSRGSADDRAGAVAAGLV